MEDLNPFRIAQAQFARAAGHVHAGDGLLETLTRPERTIRIDFPVKMDDGTIRVFTGYRVQHNSARGPYKGGVRFHPAVSEDEVKALAAWMPETESSTTSFLWHRLQLCRRLVEDRRI